MLSLKEREKIIKSSLIGKIICVEKYVQGKSVVLTGKLEEIYFKGCILLRDGKNVTPHSFGADTAAIYQIWLPDGKPIYTNRSVPINYQQNLALQQPERVRIRQLGKWYL